MWIYTHPRVCIYKKKLNDKELYFTIIGQKLSRNFIIFVLLNSKINHLQLYRTAPCFQAWTLKCAIFWKMWERCTEFWNAQCQLRSFPELKDYAKNIVKIRSWIRKSLSQWAFCGLTAEEKLRPPRYSYWNKSALQLFSLVFSVVVSPFFKVVNF